MCEDSWRDTSYKTPAHLQLTDDGDQERPGLREFGTAAVRVRQAQFVQDVPDA